MKLNTKKMRCHLNKTPDLLVDVGYQDDILATTFISLVDASTGYAKIDVFKGDQYIGHTGVVIHFEERNSLIQTTMEKQHCRTFKKQ